jgi:hypothetical protein
MKKICFIADFYSDQLNGGGESNDSNLILFLSQKREIVCYKSSEITIEIIKDFDVFIIGNFVLLGEKIKQFLIKNKKYIIYEHDHKYITTRDPSRFSNFLVPKNNLINVDFYESSYTTVVLSNICKQVININLSNVNCLNIGCSLWSDKKFNLLEQLSQVEKTNDLCLMKSDNPTKNYYKAVQYCAKNNISFDSISSKSSFEFLKLMSCYKRFLFMPKVLETFSRICAEAKMMNLEVMTNKKMIGFFSEEVSALQGLELIECLKDRNHKAIKAFESLI